MSLDAHSLLEPMVNHPATSVLSATLRPRSRLKEEHMYLFGGTSNSSATCGSSDGLLLFEELALAVCSTGVVCRKEFLETYAAATLIHARFPHIRRVADLAAGHGLLAWFLLALDLHDDESEDDAAGLRLPRTAVCVDRRMPASADAIGRGRSP